jgi:hypothetical protein
VKRWLSTWSGIGRVVVGMERQGFVVSLRRLVDDGWTASFHSHAAARRRWDRDGADAVRGGADRGVASANPQRVPTPSSTESVAIEDRFGFQTQQ